MDLIRDVLDKKIVDRNGREMGRVDSIVLQLRDNEPPRVVALELGPAVLGYRVRPILGRWVAGLEHALGIDEGRPVRIPIAKALEIDNHVKVDLAFSDTAVATLEQQLRRWVSAIPGSS